VRGGRLLKILAMAPRRSARLSCASSLLLSLDDDSLRMLITSFDISFHPSSSPACWIHDGPPKLELDQSVSAALRSLAGTCRRLSMLVCAATCQRWVATVPRILAQTELMIMRALEAVRDLSRYLALVNAFLADATDSVECEDNPHVVILLKRREDLAKLRMRHGDFEETSRALQLEWQRGGERIFTIDSSLPPAEAAARRRNVWLLLMKGHYRTRIQKVEVFQASYLSADVQGMAHSAESQATRFREMCGQLQLARG